MQNLFTSKRCMSFLLFCFLQACGGGGGPKEDPPEPRQGADLTILKGPNDFSPSLSKDGKNMVFVSTRKGTYQIFKASAELGVDANASLLMDAGVKDVNGTRLQETQAWLTPDAKTVFFTVRAAGLSNSVSLYSVNFDGTGISDLIQTVTGSIPNLVFSSDSSQFAFTSISSNTGTVYSGEVSSPLKLTTGSNSDERVLYYNDKNELITFTQDKLAKQTFTFYSNGKTVLGTSSNILNPNNPVKYSLGKNDIAYFIEDMSSANTLIKINGDIDELKKDLKDIQNQYKQIQNDKVSLFNSGAISDPSPAWTAYGQSINSISVSQSENVGVYVSTERHICKSAGVDNPPASTGRALVFANFNDSKFQSTWYIPVFDKDQNISFVSDPCETLAKGSTADIVGIQSAVINAGAKADNYRIVYSTNFQQQSKLYTIDVVSTTTTIKAVN